MLKNTKKGFTLIELLVVIAIIGILASIVLASLNSARIKSRDARRIADIKQLQIALELYYDANASTYPTTVQGLAVLATGGFISTIPKDPVGTTPPGYAYERCTNSTTGATFYHLGASLEDGGNSALIANNNGMVTGCPGTWGSNSNYCTSGDAGTHCYDVTP